MSKTRKFLTTLTMVAVTTTASLTAVSNAQAAPLGPGVIIGPGPIIDPPFPFPPGGLAPPPPPPPGPPAPPAPDPHHHGGLKPGAAAALGVLGGVLIGSALAKKNQPAPAAAGLPAAHYAYCDAKYKTYVIATNTYTGYDMKPHYCVSPYGY